MKTQHVDVRTLCDRLRADTDRWTEELAHAGPRATLSVGVQKRAWSHAESLLMGCARVFQQRIGDTESIELITSGKTTDLDRLTMGQVIDLLQYWDTRKELAGAQKVIRKPERRLLSRISAARNEFTHRAVDAANPDQIVRDIADVRQLAELRLVELAIHFEELNADGVS